MSETIFVHLGRFELGIFNENLSSYCGLLVDAKIRASDKDLPVLDYLVALQREDNLMR